MNQQSSLMSTFVFCCLGHILALHSIASAVVWSVVCPLSMLAVLRSVLRSTLVSGTFFHGKAFPSSADSRRLSCQLLGKECALSSGKLPPEGLPKNRGNK